MLERGRHDADDLITDAIQRDLLARDARIGAEAAAPQAIAEDRHSRGIGHIVFGREAAAKPWRHVEYVKVFTGDAAPFQPLGEPRAGKRWLPDARDGKRVEGAGALLYFDEIAERDLHPIAILILIPDRVNA